MTKPAPSNPLGGAVAEFVAAAGAKGLAAGRAKTERPTAVGPGLVGAFRDVLEAEALKAVPAPEHLTWWRRIGRPVAAGAIVLTAAWLWFWPPGWLAPAPGPVVLWPPGPAGRHLLLVNSADAIVLFRERSGRLPAGAELDTVAPGVGFQPLPDGGFELQSAAGDTLRAPPHSPLSGMSYELIEARERAIP